MLIPVEVCNAPAVGVKGLTGSPTKRWRPFADAWCTASVGRQHAMYWPERKPTTHNSSRLSLTLYAGHLRKTVVEVHSGKSGHGGQSCRTSLWAAVRLQVGKIELRRSPADAGRQPFLLKGCAAGDAEHKERFEDSLMKRYNETACRNTLLRTVDSYLTDRALPDLISGGGATRTKPDEGEGGDHREVMPGGM